MMSHPVEYPIIHNSISRVRKHDVYEKYGGGLFLARYEGISRRTFIQSQQATGSDVCQVDN